MRSWRSELVTLTFVLSVPTALMLTFPYEAVTFRATERTPSKESLFSFVRLSPEAQSRALKAARATWRTAESARRMRATLFVETLPNDGDRPTQTEPFRFSPSEIPPVMCDKVPYAPSFAAPPPARIPAAAPQTIPATFSRKELLELK